MNLQPRASHEGRPFFRLGRVLLDALLDFIYPPQCLVCASRIEDRPWLCPECEFRILEAVEVHVHDNPQDFRYLKEPLCFDRVVTCWPYIPEVEKLIYHVKYHQGRELGVQLGRFTADRMRCALVGNSPASAERTAFEKAAPVLPDPEIRQESAADEQADAEPEDRRAKEASEGFLPGTSNSHEPVLIPVPLHPVRKRERGYNQSSRYSLGISERLGIPVLEKVLIRKRETRSQTTLSADGRRENVRNAFAVKKPKRIEGRCIYLVDDLITSGSTLNACAKALKSAGAREVTGVALVRPKIHFKDCEFA